MHRHDLQAQPRQARTVLGQRSLQEPAQLGNLLRTGRKGQHCTAAHVCLHPLHNRCKLQNPLQQVTGCCFIGGSLSPNASHCQDFGAVEGWWH